MAREDFRPISEPAVLCQAAAPERTLVIELELEGSQLSVASFRQVAGVDRKMWGPLKKRQQFDAICEWLNTHSRHAIAGMDVNSPEVDHPDIAQNVYFFGSTPGDQHEHLLHDPMWATHVLRDAFRLYLAANPRDLEAVIAARPQGPLALSHINLQRARRFDFIYVTPDLPPTYAHYLSDDTLGALSDHALVIADLTFQPDEPPPDADVTVNADLALRAFAPISRPKG